jgi:hypothetical protein
MAGRMDFVMAGLSRPSTFFLLLCTGWVEPFARPIIFANRIDGYRDAPPILRDQEFSLRISANVLEAGRTGVGFGGG